MNDEPGVGLDEELLRLLACPICTDRPRLEPFGHYLLCPKCRMAYPILDEIPQLTPEDAVPVDQIKSQIDD